MPALIGPTVDLHAGWAGSVVSVDRCTQPRRTPNGSYAFSFLPRIVGENQ
jgi:hypothetical protein